MKLHAEAVGACGRRAADRERHIDARKRAALKAAGVRVEFARIVGGTFEEAIDRANLQIVRARVCVFCCARLHTRIA